MKPILGISKCLLQLGLFMICSIANQGLVHAADYPTKSIKVIVPSPPGGPPDLLFRVIGPKMAEAFGQPIVIENRAGAGGLVGTAYLEQLPPDGYSWLFTTASHVNIPPFNSNVTYDPVKDFTHVSLVAQNFGQVLVVRPDLGVTTVEQLINMAKKKSWEINVCSCWTRDC